MKRFLFCFPQRSAVLARQRMASILYMDRLDCPEDTVKYLKRDIRKVIRKRYLNIENAGCQYPHGYQKRSKARG